MTKKTQCNNCASAKGTQCEHHLSMDEKDCEFYKPAVKLIPDSIKKIFVFVLFIFSVISVFNLFVSHPSVAPFVLILLIGGWAHIYMTYRKRNDSK